MPRRSAPAAFIPPMLPTLVGAAPEGTAWIHEIKYDGYRTELAIARGEVRAFTRNGYDWTDRYGPVVESARALRCRSAVIDGELCVQDKAGLTSFKALRRAIRGAPERLILFCFDLLVLDGRDLREEPLLDRRRRLEDLIGADHGSRLHISGHHAGDGLAFFRAADRHGLEGIVSKRADSRYGSGRTKDWLKTKSFTVGDYQVLGVERSAAGVAVALLATTGQDPAYVGDAAVTLSSIDKDAFWDKVDRLGTPRARIGGAIARRKAAWVKEGLIARVRHMRGEEKLRHATIQSVETGASSRSAVEPRHPEDE